MERTKRIRGLGGFYKIGEFGSVWTRKKWRGRNGKWHRMKPQPQKSGHLFVRLGNPPLKRIKAYRVHVLVMRAFGPPQPAGKPEVRHLDGNPKNNRSDNLAWGTHKENHEDRILHGTNCAGEQHGGAKLTDVAVLRIRRLYDRGRETQYELAERFGVHQMTISRIVRRKIWTHI